MTRCSWDEYNNLSHVMSCPSCQSEGPRPLPTYLGTDGIRRYRHNDGPVLACACGSPASWIITALPDEIDAGNAGGAIGDGVCDAHHLQTEAYGYGVGPVGRCPEHGTVLIDGRCDVLIGGEPHEVTR